MLTRPPEIGRWFIAFLLTRYTQMDIWSFWSSSLVGLSEGRLSGRASGCSQGWDSVLLFPSLCLTGGYRGICLAWFWFLLGRKRSGNCGDCSFSEVLAAQDEDPSSIPAPALKLMGVGAVQRQEAPWGSLAGLSSK